jgi:hypothetical protein
MKLLVVWMHNEVNEGDGKGGERSLREKRLIEKRAQIHFN